MSALHQTLLEAHVLLVRHGEVQWARNLERAAAALARDEAEGVHAVLGLFGGMGSLTDRLPIESEPDASALKALVDRAFDLVHRRRKALTL